MSVTVGTFAAGRRRVLPVARRGDLPGRIATPDAEAEEDRGDSEVLEQHGTEYSPRKTAACRPAA